MNPNKRSRNDSLVCADSYHVQLWEYGSKVCSPLLGYPQTGLYAAYEQVSSWTEGQGSSEVGEKFKRERKYGDGDKVKKPKGKMKKRMEEKRDVKVVKGVRQVTELRTQKEHGTRLIHSRINAHVHVLTIFIVLQSLLHALYQASS
jgi:hypothetical protein